MSTDRVRRQAAGWARAFPPRWRVAHLDEFVDTVEAMVPPGSDRLPPRMTRDILLAGWRERRRTRPPIGRWCWYALAGGRLPARWHPWMRDDVTGRWFWLRRCVRFSSVPPLTITAIWVPFALSGPSVPVPYPWPIAAAGLLAAPLMISGTARQRAQILRQHGFEDDAITRASLPAPWSPAPSASHPLAGIAAVVGVVLLALGSSMLLPHALSGRWAIEDVITRMTLAAGLVGLVLGAALARRVRRARAAPVARPTLDPDGRRRRRLAQGGAVIFAALGGPILALSPPADAGGAFPAAVASAFGLAALVVAGAARRRRGEPAVTWADLIAGGRLPIGEVGGPPTAGPTRAPQ